MVEVLRTRHYSRGTEEACVLWIRRLALFGPGAHPRRLVAADFNRFLTHLAVKKEDVAGSTQNEALAALLLLYEHVLEQPLTG